MSDFPKHLDPRVAKNLAMLADIKVTVTIEVGTRRMPLREVLLLSAGDLVALQRGANDPLTLKVGDKILAYCELVQNGHQTSIRITEVCGQDIFTNLMQAV